MRHGDAGVTCAPDWRSANDSRQPCRALRPGRGSDVGLMAIFATTRSEAGRTSIIKMAAPGIRRRLRVGVRGWRGFRCPVKALVCNRASLRCSGKPRQHHHRTGATEAAGDQQISLPSSMLAMHRAPPGHRCQTRCSMPTQTAPHRLAVACPSQCGEFQCRGTAALSALPAGRSNPAQPAWAVERTQGDHLKSNHRCSRRKGHFAFAEGHDTGVHGDRGAVHVVQRLQSHGSVNRFKCPGDVVAAAEQDDAEDSRVVRTSGGSMRLMVHRHQSAQMRASGGVSSISACATSGMVPVTTKRAPDDRCGCGYGWLLPVRGTATAGEGTGA